MKKLLVLPFLLLPLFADMKDCLQYYEKEQEYLKKAQETKMYETPFVNMYSNLSTAYGIMFRNCLIKECMEGTCEKGKCMKIFW